MATDRVSKVTFRDLGVAGDDFSQLKKFFGFSAADEKRLGALKAETGNYSKELVEQVFSHMISSAEVKNLLSDPAVMDRVKRLQFDYYEQMTSGLYDMAYADSRIQIGSEYNAINYLPRWYVGGFAHYLDALADRLLENSADTKDAYSGLKAVSKLMLLDSALSMEAFLLQRERQMQKQQESIREAETFMRSLLDAAINIAIYGISSEGSIQSWNKGAENLLGYMASDIIGQDFRKLFPEDEVQTRQVENQFREASEKGIVETVGWRRRRNGTKFLARMSTAVMKDQNGNITGFVELVQDETERLQTQQRLEEQRKHIADLIKVLSEVTSQISSIASELSASTAQAVSAIAETTSTSEQVKRMAELTSQQAKDVSMDAKSVVEVSRQGQEATESTIKGMARISQQMESIADGIVQLNNQSKLIGDIINTVDDLAQQSNLLAINASIEAAKAGEHGKGFAVVAQEVKNLSQQSKEATANVRTILNEIIKATAASTAVIEQGSKAVEAGHQQASNAGAVIKTLSDNIEKASRTTELIEESSQQQLSGMQEVVGSMDSIKLSSQRNLDSVKRLDIAGKELTELGRRLLEMTMESENTAAPTVTIGK